jgi:RNA-directed DNA polymerase
LNCYDPLDRPDKADIGQCHQGFDFLGCNVRFDRVRPTKESRRRLLEKVRTVLEHAAQDAVRSTSRPMGRSTYFDALAHVSRMVQGWGNTYFFCTDDNLFAALDIEIAKLIEGFHDRYRIAFRQGLYGNLRDLLGVFHLRDCNKDANFRMLVRRSGAAIASAA